MKAIVTPTYKGHFKFIKPYLETFNLFVKDKGDIVIYFTVSREEIEEFNKIVSPYSVTCNIKVFAFEDILEQQNIFLTSELLLRRYGRFSFQTLKKFYTMLAVNEEQILVLDSESIWWREVNLTEAFDAYFKSPKVWISSAPPSDTPEFKKKIIQTTEYTLRNSSLTSNLDGGGYWVLENFCWFYSKHILENMFDVLGSPFSIVENAYQHFGENGHIFEISIYQGYLIASKVEDYKVIKIDEEAKKYLSPKVWQEYYYYQYCERIRANGGVFEDVTRLLNKDNIKELALFLKYFSFDIIRCERGSHDGDLKMFMDILNPYVLAASQDNIYSEKYHPKRKRTQFKKLLKRLKNIFC